MDSPSACSTSGRAQTASEDLSVRPAARPQRIRACQLGHRLKNALVNQVAPKTILEGSPLTPGRSAALVSACVGAETRPALVTASGAPIVFGESASKDARAGTLRRCVTSAGFASQHHRHQKTELNPLGRTVRTRVAMLPSGKILYYPLPGRLRPG